MKLCRFNTAKLGLVEHDSVLDVTAALDLLPRSTYPFPRHDVFIEHLESVKSRVVELLPAATRLPLDAVRLVSPVANPGKIMAAPVNYTKHLEEAREQSAIHHNNRIEEIRRVGLFLKANSSLCGPNDTVVIPRNSIKTDWEVELGVVIGQRASYVDFENALD